MTDNELIAEFMGGDISGGWVTFNTPPSSMFTSYNWDTDKLLYHVSWDWLMPVVGMIESLNFEVSVDSQVETVYDDRCIILHQDCHISDGVKYYAKGYSLIKIKAVYKAVVEFIKWYNQQK